MTHVTQNVLTHGAVVLFAWILAQQVGAPIPSVPLLLVVGSLASSGRVNVISVLGASFGACLTADGFWYHVGRSGWSISNYVRPRTSGWASRALRIIHEHAAGALLLAKFISCSNVAALVAGKTGIRLERFLIFDSIASFLWAGGYIAIGYLIGNRVEVALRYASAPLLVLLGLFVAWFLLKLVRSVRRPRLHAVLPAILSARRRRDNRLERDTQSESHLRPRSLAAEARSKRETSELEPQRKNEKENKR